ncbi:RNA-binding transcriptional accessory protein [Bacteroidia bacterium]|nr:RNA-binding transcriptional accessory protein [Bacteroidia bacterium]
MLSNLISQRLNLPKNFVENVVELLEQGATIPFIARYRKEMSGGMDEVQIAAIDSELKRLKELVKRKETILKTISELERLTPELQKKIEDCWDSTELEDIYLPYKPKRRTKAQIAIENGLEPLAKIISVQNYEDIYRRAEKFLNEKVPTAEDAVSGAQDIIAEWVNENISARNSIRYIFSRKAKIRCKVVKGKEIEADKYRDYFEVEESLNRISSHRLLAIRRGENEGFLKVDISADESECFDRLQRIFVKNDSQAADLVADAVKDSYKRLLKPSIETEFAASSKEKADEEAIRIFSENLKQLLMSAPLGQKRVLGIDPGFRTGCKITALDEQGNLLFNDTIYPHPPVGNVAAASEKVENTVKKYKIEAIAIGNGTASRETERFVKSLDLANSPQIFVVSENGASIYSASEIGRAEFPDYDLTVRGAVSIGRRLLDPLAELVKIDPKSIGVGQYQHDVNQKELKNALDFVVISCVNNVGVNLNTASKYLLTYISGIGQQLAQNIVNFRKENGSFKNRKELLKVPKMGTKSFEQCAGFIRVENSDNPLDNSAVHPESYCIVEKMAKDLNTDISNLLSSKEIRQNINVKNYVTANVGLPTLNDILKELDKNSRDPRTEVEVFSFDERVKEIDDLEIGMILPGIVTNITKFGAFVDIGVHENGLLHISQMSDKRINDPTEVVKLHQHLQVKVIELDYQRKRIALSLKF